MMYNGLKSKEMVLWHVLFDLVNRVPVAVLLVKDETLYATKKIS